MTFYFENFIHEYKYNRGLILIPFLLKTSFILNWLYSTEIIKFSVEHKKFRCFLKIKQSVQIVVVEIFFGKTGTHSLKKRSVLLFPSFVVLTSMNLSVPFIFLDKISYPIPSPFV